MWFGTMSTMSPMLVRAQLLDEAPQAVLAAQFGIDLRVVDDVVAVRGAGGRGRDRRHIRVADAELREVVDERGGVVESEALVKLEPKRGARYGHGVSGSRRVRSVARSACARGIDGEQPVGEGIVEKQFVDGPRHAPAPVRMLVDRAGQVRLVREREQVFERIGDERRGRRGDERERFVYRRVVDGGGASTSSGATPASWNARHRCARSSPRSSSAASTGSRPSARAVVWPIFVRHTMSSPRHQPVTVGRSCVVVVAVDAAVPFARRLEAGAVHFALEPQHANAEQAVILQAFA